MQSLQEVINLIDASIKEDANNMITAGGIIQEGYDKEVDEGRNFIEHANDWLNDYTQNLVSETGITTLKIKYTSASGYFIEVPLSQSKKIPENFVHKTTLVNALRFTTSELKQFEVRIINAESELYAREYMLFKEVSSKILEHFQAIKSLSGEVAHIDLISNFSDIAYENDYIKPEMQIGYDLEIL